MSFLNSQIPSVGSTTNNSDPMSVNSRVFVGGLNTMELSRDDVKEIFRRYGLVTDISMHKGYCFVQYVTPVEARQAVLGEDQRTYAEQTLDVNIVSEPKFKPKKRFKGPKSDQGSSAGSETPKTITLPKGEDMHKYENPDILICGNCKRSYCGIEALAEHKRNKCELKTVCKCQEMLNGPSSFMCATCNNVYSNSWELIQHSQQDHGLMIYIKQDVMDNQEMVDEPTGNGN